MKVICKQCGKEFELNPSEIEFYQKKNLALPKRCKECRELNKQGGSYKEDNQNVAAQERETQTSVNAGGTSKMQSAEVQKSGPKKTIYGVAAAVLVAIAALVGSYFGLDLTGTDTGNDKSQNVVVQNEDSTGEENASSEDTDTAAEADKTAHNLTFRNDNLLQSHYQKHGIEMGFASAEEYEKAANVVLDNPNTLHKTEAEDGDDVYYLESSNELVIVSTDGYLRTYFNPSAGIDYYNRT